MFCHFCLLLLLCCSFGSLCVRFFPPSKTACGCSPVLFSPPRPACKNEGMHIACNFLNFICNLLVSLCISCFTHPFLPRFFDFFENMLPALVGEHDFENCINVKSNQKQLLRPSSRTDYTCSEPVYGTWNLQNRLEKCVFLAYGPSSEALFA